MNSDCIKILRVEVMNLNRNTVSETHLVKSGSVSGAGLNALGLSLIERSECTCMCTSTRGAVCMVSPWLHMAAHFIHQLFVD